MCAVLILVITSCCVVLAQSPGAISGHAVDSAGAVLQGARVELQPRVTPTVTGAQGEFTIPDLPPGKYSLTVAYLGFTTFSTDVAVTSGEVTRVEATLTVATKNEQVTVYGGRQHGEAEAINRERTSDNILQVLPNEVITSLPNTNVADALGRLPSVTLERDEGEGKYVQIRGLEPRLSNVTIDGVNVPSPESGVRQIKLDVIPANLVESVEINKTLSANQDGDAIGGSVNLVNKTASERPTLYLNGIGGYTPILGGRSLTEVDGTVGKRFGAEKRLGILIGGSYDWNGRGIDDVEPSPHAAQCDASGCDGDLQSNAPFFSTYDGLDLREYRYYRTRYGFGGSIDYKLGDTSGLYAHLLYSHFDNFGDRWVYGFGIDSFDAAPATSGTGSMGFSSQIRRPVEVIGSLAVGGKHVFSKSWLSYDLSVSRSSEEDHGYSSAKFDGPEDIPFAINTTNPLRPNIVPQGGTNVFDPSQYTLNSLEISKAYGPQLNLQGAASMARNYTLGGHFATFEFGGKFRNAHKFQDTNDFIYDSGTNPAMTTFLGTFTNPDYYDKSYAFGPTTEFSKITSFFNANRSDFPLNESETRQSTDPNNYDLIEHVSAGYLMNTVNFGSVRLQTGLRFEGTSENILGYHIQLDDSGDYIPGSTTPVRRDFSYLDVLPSVQLRFAVGQDAAIRAVYGRGIARPNFGDLPPFQVRDDSNQMLSVGNPDLKPTHSNSFDLLFEQYLKPLGLIQAGVFYKDLSDPIYLVGTPITSGTFAGFTQEQPINGPSAHLLGFEIAYVQHLSFLPGSLSGLGMAANYSYTTSQGSVPLRTDRPSLQRQAPNTWNISPTYDRGRVSIRLGISHNDANIFSYNFFNLNPDGSPNPVPLGKNGPSGDTYLYAHTQVDAQGSFRMYRGLQLIVSGLNLTNEVFGFYNGSSHNVLQREYYKPSYSVGLRYTLSNEPK